MICQGSRFVYPALKNWKTTDAKCQVIKTVGDYFSAAYTIGVAAFCFRFGRNKYDTWMLGKLQSQLENTKWVYQQIKLVGLLE